MTRRAAHPQEDERDEGGPEADFERENDAKMERWEKLERSLENCRRNRPKED